MVAALACAAYIILLAASLSSRSLWTDEAFSAWLASHRSFAGFIRSLASGDSSDLQMPLYYLYLFSWVKLFGFGEYALRAANLPFVVLFGVALAYTSVRVFKRPLAWLVPGLLPFAWWYVNEARAYFAVLACSTLLYGSLLIYLRANHSSRRTGWCWAFLASFVLGSLLHMLFVFAAIPCLVLFYLLSNTVNRANWRDWRFPILVSGPLLLCIAAFYAYTFLRGTAYAYPQPGMFRVVYAVYELLGLSGIGPPRGDLWSRPIGIVFSPYLLPLSLAIIFIAAAVILPLSKMLPKDAATLRRALAYAVLAGCLEVLCACLLTGYQFYLRHLTSLVPLFLFLYLSLLGPAPVQNKKIDRSMISLVLLGAVWVTANVRMSLSAANWKEDCRSAAATALNLSRKTRGSIVWAADPVAAAYYGIPVLGDAPCFPVLSSCAEEWSRVAWPDSGTGILAAHWDQQQIQAFLTSRQAASQPLVLVRTSFRTDSENPWQHLPSSIAVQQETHLHGFDVLLLNTNAH